MRKIWCLLCGSGATVVAGSAFKIKTKLTSNGEEPTKSDMKKSVVIVGAGLMGLGTALHLSDRGHKVTVIERSHQVADR